MVSDALRLSDAPYPGLRPFRPDEADIFFGRERQVDDLLARLGEHRFLAVVGPSGCGKSSLIAAGLRPALASGFMASAGAHWRVADLRPGAQPIHHLAGALLAAGVIEPEHAGQPDAEAFLEAALRRGPLGLIEIVRRSPLERDPALRDVSLLVIVDQFEELSKLSDEIGRDEVGAFVELLLASAAAREHRIYVVITMRSDYLGDYTAFHGLPEAINDGLYLTPRLTREECAACITEPAHVFGADVEPALVNRLLNDFGPDPDQLPLLQHALSRMWNRHAGDRPAGCKTVLGVADYQAIGGLARALSDHVDEAFAALGPGDRRIAEVMFRRLSDSETARRDQRAPAPVREIAALAGAAVADVVRVADAFRRADRCFLTPRHDVVPDADTLLDVSHESLLRQWTRAVGWIKEEADAVGLYRRLQDAARDWKRGDAALWSAARLDRALAWRDHATSTWALRYGRTRASAADDFAAVCDFIAAARDARDARRIQDRRARFRRVRRAIAAGIVALLAFGGAYTLGVRRYLWESPHAAHYASYVRVSGQPRGLRGLTRDEVRHRDVSYRIVTAGRWGHVVSMSAVNGRDQPIGVAPEYAATGRTINTGTARWQYEYDATGQLAAEHQYTRRGELVLSKIYVPLRLDRECMVVFLNSDGLPTPVRDREGSPYYWAERLRYAPDGREQRISYLGLWGEPTAGRDRAFGRAMEYDARGHETSLASLDRSGQPMNDAEGNAFLVIMNDAAGDPVEAVALDARRRPTTVRDGWAIRRARFDASGNRIELAYFDERGRPVASRDGWHRATYRRDAQGRVRGERYFDRDGEPTTDTALGCYGFELSYDSLDRKIRQTCVDAGGASRVSRDGSVTTVWQYDDRDQIQEEAYLDASDRAMMNWRGYAYQRHEYDSKRRRVDVAYLDARRQPVQIPAACAGYSVTYDDKDNTERTRYWSTDRSAALMSRGYASMLRRRDAGGNVIEERYFEEHGEAAFISEGYAGWRAILDARGRQLEIMYLGKAGEPVVSKKGYASWTGEYDDLGGRPIVTHLLDLWKRPAVRSYVGVSGWRSTFDPWSNEVERMYLDWNDDPAISLRGEAGWRAEYDRTGRQTKLAYLTPDRRAALHTWDSQPAIMDSGFATQTWTYDAHGNRLDEAYFGIDEEPVMSPDGWSRAAYEYDDLGRLVRTSYFDAAGRPARWQGKYHTVTQRYDERGNITERRYFDVDRETTVTGSASRTTIAYDEYDRVKELIEYYEHTTVRTVTTWNARGQEIRRDTYEVDGAPVKLGATEYRYDAWGNSIEEHHLDPHDQPVATRDEPCATTTRRFSERQDLLEIRCLGVDGQLSRHLSNGAARIEYVYGRPGEQLSESYFDEQYRPFTTADGFAGILYEYDPAGREIAHTYLDVRGAAVVVAAAGYARMIRRYDREGNAVELGLFLTDGRPVRPVTWITSEFDARRRRIRERYFGHDPASPGASTGTHPALLLGNGQHETVYEYDELGRVRELRYLDARGQPTRGYARALDPSGQLCWRWVARYSVDGRLTGYGACEQAR